MAEAIEWLREGNPPRIANLDNMSIFAASISNGTHAHITRTRIRYAGGDCLPPVKGFQQHVGQMTGILQPTRFTETLAVVGYDGALTKYTAPRWYIHLMALRHLQ